MKVGTGPTYIIVQIVPTRSGQLAVFLFYSFFSDKDVLTLTMTVVNVAPLKTPLATLDQFHIEDKKKKE